MTSTATLFLIAGLGLITWVFARARAGRFIQSGAASVHSLPSYHGWYAAMWAVVPAILFLLVWSSVAPALGSFAVLDSPLAAQLPT
ncbi:MAG: phosphate ABC transporter permease family protein, partial [Blastomonas fulva]